MVVKQTYLFLMFLLDGLIIGIFFDFFRILRKSFNTSDIVTYIEDFLFWLLTGILILYSIFTFNNGEIRIYMFIGIILGITFYMLTISTYIIKINVIIIKFCKELLIKTVSIRNHTLELEREKLMKKSKKIYKKLIILAIATYVIFTLVSQQKTLNQYENQNQKLTEQIAQEKESKEELAKKKEDVNSLEFIEQTAREKLDMYYPNEKVYMDQGM